MYLYAYNELTYSLYQPLYELAFQT